ncbi:hypothetical protein AVEN_225878-1 [Araneus ventricosus]|uniref:Uncharacterized protein n=1 Tax=Araneus ventricosus TaxID=182803 RepID=A0A4Y2BCZ8_ARAVE|nr:hypothetical protein AVEN_225878-1 [Araneus ventricosus]
MLTNLKQEEILTRCNDCEKTRRLLMSNAVVGPAEESAIVGGGDGHVGGVADHPFAGVLQVVVLVDCVAEFPFEGDVCGLSLDFTSHDDALVQTHHVRDLLVLLTDGGVWERKIYAKFSYP